MSRRTPEAAIITRRQFRRCLSAFTFTLRSYQNDKKGIALVPRQSTLTIRMIIKKCISDYRFVFLCVKLKGFYFDRNYKIIRGKESANKVMLFLSEIIEYAMLHRHVPIMQRNQYHWRRPLHPHAMTTPPRVLNGRRRNHHFACSIRSADIPRNDLSACVRVG